MDMNNQTLTNIKLTKTNEHVTENNKHNETPTEH